MTVATKGGWESAPPKYVRVWDPLVRASHWVLVAAFAIAYLSAEEETGGPDPLHVWAGYVVGGLVLLRVLWGFVGPRHARFSDFAYHPLKTFLYLRDLLLGRGRRYLGHSPAGGAMVIGLLCFLAATVATGVVAYGEQGKGPLAVATNARVSGGEVEHGAGFATAGEQESITGELHSLFANLTLALVVMHILGVGLASFQHRENLVASMISGKKRRRSDD